MLLSAAVLFGSAAGLWLNLGEGETWAGAVAAATLACVGSGRRWRAAWALVTVWSIALALGAAARDRSLRPPLVVWFDEIAGADDRAGDLVWIDGVLVTDAARVAGGVRLLLDVSTVRDARGQRVAPGRLQAHVAGDLAPGWTAEWTAGRRVRAPVALRRPQMLLNVGGASPRWQTLRRPFALTGSIKSAALVEVERGAWWDEAAAALRRRVRAAAARFIAPHSELGAAITTAILIGDRAGLTEDVERRLQEAGTYHVIAISGGNVALLAALGYGVLRLFLRSPRAVAVITLAMVLAFGWVVGAEPSVSRAIVVASAYLCVSLAGLRPAPLAVLRLAAALLVLYDPLTVIDAGAWLSFGATFGIIRLAAPWARALRCDLGPPAARAVWRSLVVITAATLAAEAVIVPIAALVFARVSLAGVLLNLIAIPAMAVVQIAGLATVFAGALWEDAASLGGWAASAAARVLVGSSALVDVWPWLSWRVPHASPAWVIAYYAAGLCALEAASRRWRAAAIACAAGSLAGVLISPGLERATPRPGRIRITVLDVGQGDAVLVQLSGRRAFIVDAGGTTGSFDLGGRVVTPAAWSLGVRRLEWLVLSHGDRDHIGGAASVLRDLQPREIWEGVPVPRDTDRARLREVSASLGLPWRTVEAGARLEVGDVAIEALHPPPPEWERQRVRNDDSLVLRLRYGQVDTWLTGDAGAEFERRLPADADRAAVRILKVGHHGSRTATSPALVSALRPQIAIVSAGRGNLFGHPSPDVLARLSAAGAAIFRTDRDGAVVVETDGVTARVWTARGRTWSVSVVQGP